MFTKKGLDIFNADMWEVDEFFQPEMMNLALNLVKHQRERNKTAAKGQKVTNRKRPFVGLARNLG